MVTEQTSYWRDQAACLGTDRELFFPVNDMPGQVRRAKEVCARCGVQTQCLEWALVHGADAGIWGGLTSPERRVLNRSRHR